MDFHEWSRRRSRSPERGREGPLVSSSYSSYSTTQHDSQQNSTLLKPESSSSSHVIVNTASPTRTYKKTLTIETSSTPAKVEQTMLSGTHTPLDKTQQDLQMSLERVKSLTSSLDRVQSRIVESRSRPKGDIQSNHIEERPNISRGEDKFNGSSRLEDQLNQSNRELREETVLHSVTSDVARQLSESLHSTQHQLSASKYAEDRLRDDLERTRLEQGAKLESLREENTTLQLRLSQRGSEIANLRHQLDEATNAIYHREEIIRQYEERLHKLEFQQKSSREKVSELERNQLDSARDMDNVVASRHELNILVESLQQRNSTLSREIQELIAARDNDRLSFEEELREMQFKGSLHEERISELEHENQGLQTSYEICSRELTSLKTLIEEKEVTITELQVQVRTVEEESQRALREAQHFGSTTDRITLEYDDFKIRILQRVEELQTEIASLKNENYDLQSQLVAMDSEKAIAVGSKTDLLQENTRLKKQLEERDATLRKLTRTIEGKDQTIAELSLIAKDSKRLTASYNFSHATHSPTRSPRWK